MCEISSFVTATNVKTYNDLKKGSRKCPEALVSIKKQACVTRFDCKHSNFDVLELCPHVTVLFPATADLQS